MDTDVCIVCGIYSLSFTEKIRSDALFLEDIYRRDMRKIICGSVYIVWHKVIKLENLVRTAD